MIILLHSHSAHAALAIGIAATTAGSTVDMVATLPEFASGLYRDPDAMGILYQEGWTSAVDVVHELRLADVRNLISVFVDTKIERDQKLQARARARVLNAGADDVQSWPIEAKEIAARIDALARRTRPDDDVLVLGPSCSFHPGNHQMVAGALTIQFTRQESRLLQLLIGRAGACVSKDNCVRALYEERDEPRSDTKIIDVFIHKIRRKLSAVYGSGAPIETVWGQGYRFNLDVARAAA